MPISKGDRRNFQTILEAARRGDLALLECVDTESGTPRSVVCAVNRRDQEFEFVQLAKLFHGNPYNELEPPK
jgi:Family of unknown function (DUF6117)